MNQQPASLPEVIDKRDVIEKIRSQYMPCSVRNNYLILLPEDALAVLVACKQNQIGIHTISAFVPDTQGEDGWGEVENFELQVPPLSYTNPDWITINLQYYEENLKTWPSKYPRMGITFVQGPYSISSRQCKPPLKTEGLSVYHQMRTG